MPQHCKIGTQFVLNGRPVQVKNIVRLGKHLRVQVVGVEKSTTQLVKLATVEKILCGS